MPGGRPPKVRSRPTSGVGGREFTRDEKQELFAIGERYSLDLEDKPASDGFINRLWAAYGSYCAAEDALALQVGVADEARDLKTLLQRAQCVLPLVEQSSELKDDLMCLAAAAELKESLDAFPNLHAAQTIDIAVRAQFVDAKRELQMSLIYVRLWAAHRAHFANNLKLLIDVCQHVVPPRPFTKRPKNARHMFQRELEKIYGDLLHPQRRANWQETRRGPNDPPPPESGPLFSRLVMEVLGVPFEVKKVSG